MPSRRLGGLRMIGSDVADRVYRELFCRQLGVVAPVVPPAEIVHWIMVARMLALVHLPLHHVPTYVGAGYFYAVHTPPPTGDAVRRAIALARERSAFVLFPAVRRGAWTERLESEGFVALPWFVESEYRVHGGVDEDLRMQLGGKRYRELRRMERRCDESYRTTVLVGSALASAPGAFEEFERLHSLNLATYGHARNQYPAASLKRLAESPLRARMLMLLRRPRAGGPCVQAMFGLLEPEDGRVVVPVHGIDHERVPRRHNLYATGCTALYRWGVARGLTAFGLGRGAERTKLDLGANTFYVLDNLVHAAGGATLDGLDELLAACGERISSGLHELDQAAEQRGVRDLMRTPAPRHQAHASV